MAALNGFYSYNPIAKPRDKAKAEAGVFLAERWIQAKLRNWLFLSLHHLNQAIFKLLEELNKKCFSEACRQPQKRVRIP
jgi:hypothetical protein